MREREQRGHEQGHGHDRERDREQVAARVRELVAHQLGIDRGDCSPDASILDDLGADSLDVVELVMAIEETFGLEVPDEEVEALRTLGDVEKYVVSRVCASGPGRAPQPRRSPGSIWK